jgi:hypothetical protein
MPGKLIGVAKGVVLGLVTVVVLLVVLEIGTRLFSNITPPLRIRDRDIGQKYLPGFSGEIYTEESEQLTAVRFTRDGFRGEDRPYGKPPGSRRVAILGDSQIAAIATEEQNTLVARLETLLNREYPQVRWEVMNFGVSAASTGQELILYRRLVTRYDPDLVVCAYYVGNDFADNSSRLDTNPRIYMNLDDEGNLYLEPYSASRKRLSAWLNRNSRFYVWQKTRFQLLAHRVAQSEAFYELRGGELIFLDRDTETLDHAWRLNEAILDAFRDEVEADGRVFLLAFLPCSFEIYGDRWEYFLGENPDEAPDLERDYPRRRLEEIATRGGIDYLFLHDVLGEYIAGRPHDDPDAQVLWKGYGHMNDRGNDLSARAILEHLQETGTIEALVSSSSGP